VSPIADKRVPVRHIVLGLWMVAALVASVGPVLRHENNFEIFRSSWCHLANGEDLYAASRRYFDLFKYTPSFPVLFAPFGILPFAVALVLWNMLNAATLYVALGRLLTPWEATVARIIAFADMIGSLQNAQSNALIAGLIILSYTEILRRRYAPAAAAVAVGTFVKVFPLASASFALLAEKRARFAMWLFVFAVAVFAAPLLMASPQWLSHQYDDWLLVQRVDAGDPGFSLMALLHLWLGVTWHAWPQQLIGVVALTAPLIWRSGHDVGDAWRLRYVASLLIFCVLFNHQSEPPSFVIAMTGVGVWFAITERRWWTWLVLSFTFVLSHLATSGAVPAALRSQLFAFRIKTVPFLVVWVILQIDLWSYRRGAQPRQSISSPSDVLATN
jgi:hypothetical protein